MSYLDNIILAICKKIVKLFMKKQDDTTVEGLVQFVKFGIVGVTNTVISYVINVIVLLLMEPLNISWDYFVGNIIAFILSVLWSFYWNNKYVFTLENGKNRSLFKALLKTYISYGFTGISLNNILSWFWISVLSISKYVAPIINLIASVPINFIMNKFWAFKEQ